MRGLEMPLGIQAPKKVHRFMLPPPAAAAAEAVRLIPFNGAGVAWFHGSVNTPSQTSAARHFLGIHDLMWSQASRLFVTVLGYPS
jgi:hypothetical protein